MEFRIAPMILVVFNLIFITLANPAINTLIPLKDLADFSKILIPFGLIFILSVGTFIRHSYYSTAFKIAYYLFQGVNIGMLIFYIVTVKAEHL